MHATLLRSSQRKLTFYPSTAYFIITNTGLVLDPVSVIISDRPISIPSTLLAEYLDSSEGRSIANKQSKLKMSLCHYYLFGGVWEARIMRDYEHRLTLVNIANQISLSFKAKETALMNITHQKNNELLISIIWTKKGIASSQQPNCMSSQTVLELLLNSLYM